MPIIRSYETTEVVTIVGSITVTLPTHETNDLLLVFVAKDTTTGTAPSTPAGWTAGASASAGTAARGTWFYKIAASASETNPTSTSSDTDEWHAVAISIKNVNTTTPINTSATGSSDNTMPFTGTTVTTTSNNCLVFHGYFSDQGNAPAAYPTAGVMNLSNQDAGTVSCAVAWEFKRTSGTTTARTFYGRTNDDSVIFTVAVADDGNNTEVPGYIDPGTSACTLIHGFQGTADNPTGNTYPASILISPIGGLTHTYVAGVAVTDTGANPYQTSTQLASNSTTTTTGLRVTLASAQALTTGYLLGTYQFSTPRELIDLGKYSAGGMIFIASDAANDYKAWMIGAKDSATTPADARTNYAIQIDQTTATTWANSGTVNDITNIQLSAIMSSGTLACNFNLLVLVNKIVVAGGTSTYPLDFEDLFSIANTNLIPMMQRRGATDALCWAPFQIGGGNDPCHVVVDLKYFQFPEAFNATEKKLDWHVDADQVGFDFYGVSGDTVKFTNCVFTSESSYYWSINSSASSGATWDFSGTTVVNATVTLRAVYTFTDMTFIGCGEITTNGASIQDSTIRETRAGTAAGAIAFTSATNGNAVDRIVFINNNDGDIGHSVRITATGTYTFDGHTFFGGGVAARSFNTGTGINSGTDILTTDAAHGYVDGDAVYYQDQGGSQAIGLTDGTMYYVNAQSTTTLSFHTSKADAIADTSKVNLTSGGSETHYIYSAKADVYNDSGGSVTIDVQNLGDTPTIRNSNGSSTTVNNSVTLEINGVVQNTQCYMVTSGAVVVMNEAASEAVSGNEYKATESYNYTGATTVTVRAREMGYLPFETTGSITSAGLTVTAVWLTDPNWKLVVSDINISFTNPTTITRASGNFTTDGWISTMSQVTVEGSASNDGTYTLSAVGTTTVTITGATVTTASAASGITLTFTRRSLT